MSIRKSEVDLPTEDGGFLHLRGDFNAYAAFEEATGVDLMRDGLPIDEKGHLKASASQLRALIWSFAKAYALKHGDEPPTIEQVGSELTPGVLNNARDVFGHLVGRKEGDEGPRNPTPEGEAEPTPEAA